MVAFTTGVVELSGCDQTDLHNSDESRAANRSFDLKNLIGYNDTSIWKLSKKQENIAVYDGKTLEKNVPNKLKNFQIKDILL
jgi:hypothetical protein